MVGCTGDGGDDECTTRTKHNHGQTAQYGKGEAQSAQRRGDGGGCAVVVCVVLCSGGQSRCWYVLARAGATGDAGTRVADDQAGERAGRQSQRNAKTTDAFSFAGVEREGGGQRDEITWRPGATKGGGIGEYGM